MKSLTIYDPAMCCSTGICGAEIDQKLVTFAADLDWLITQGVDVKRIGLSSEPTAFAENAQVKALLEHAGVEGLPAILADGMMKSSAEYPGRATLAGWAGLATDDIPAAQPAETKSCCGDSDGDVDMGGCC